MDKTITTSDTLQQDALSCLFQKTDISPGHSSASPEKEPEEVVPQV
jgi:hypothetical protein